MKNKRKALCALGALMFFGSSLGVFILAADEQSIVSNSSPAPDRVTLNDLVAGNARKNQHVELTGFYFGKQYIYTTELVQFNEVYVPIFPVGAPESATYLQVLFWIRNDRNSNQPLIESPKQLDEFVDEFNRSPRPVAGILRRPMSRVRELTAEAYPGVHADSLLVLSARHFPDQQSVSIFWGICGFCFLAAVGCIFAYRRCGTQTRFERA